jgi:hypothetical protein
MSIKKQIIRGNCEGQTLQYFKTLDGSKEYLKDFEKDLKYYSVDQMYMIQVCKSLDEILLVINSDLDFWSQE